MTRFLQVFQQQFCLNITMNQHLTRGKLIDIMTSHKVNSRSPFTDERLQLNQRQILSDIELVVSTSASCTSAGNLFCAFCCAFCFLLKVFAGTSEKIYSTCFNPKSSNFFSCNQCCFEKCTETGYLPCRSPDQSLGSLPSRCKAWCLGFCQPSL
jgi:hypothetical protein